MQANAQQVGGSHYQSEYQHWDLVEDLKLPYLMAQVTRYVTRWRKKNGVEDLQKAIHYIKKAQEQRNKAELTAYNKIADFCYTNGSAIPEKEIFELAATFSLGNYNDLIKIEDKLNEMLFSLNTIVDPKFKVDSDEWRK